MARASELSELIFRDNPIKLSFNKKQSCYHYAEDSSVKIQVIHLSSGSMSWLLHSRDSYSPYLHWKESRIPYFKRVGKTKKLCAIGVKNIVIPNLRTLEIYVLLLLERIGWVFS